MGLRRFFFVLSCLLPLSMPAFAEHVGHWSGTDGWHGHSGWRGTISHFDHGYWQGGHWWHGSYGGRLGWWWIVGPDWYWYPGPIYPYPNPYLPPGAVTGFWYWCDFYHQYYPFVGACPSGWRAVPAQ